MVFRRYEDIVIWQKGRELVKAIYALTRADAFAKDWGLRDQIQRSVVSICSNVAEGHARRGNEEFIKFLWIAKGSAAEVQSQLYHAKDLGYIQDDQFQTLYEATELIQIDIFKLIQTLDANSTRQKV